MRRQMRRFVLTSAVLALLAGAAARARADLTLTFNAAGTFEDGATLGGTLTIDTTSGMVTAANLTVGAPQSLTFIYIQNTVITSAATTEIDLGSPGYDPAQITLYMYLPTTTLTGYLGGPLDPGTGISVFHTYGLHSYYSYDELVGGGSLNVAVPEPSTLLVACVGGVCAIAYGVAKKRRAARNTTSAA